MVYNEKIFNGRNSLQKNSYVELLSDKNFETELLRSKLALVDFSAAWCGPCKQLEPTLDELSLAYNGRIKVFKVDISANQALAIRFNIMSVPTLILFKDGVPRAQINGLVPKANLEKLLDENL